MNAANSPIEQRPVRVLIVESSETARNRLLTLLRADPTFQVVGTAGNGQDAVRAAGRAHPDVVLMDAALPEMGAVAATATIMRDWPTPVVVMVSGPGQANRSLAEDALKAGALAILNKPSEVRDGGSSTAELLLTLRGMARIKVVRRLRPPEGLPDERLAVAAADRGRPAARIVAIGASTGGPQALHTILTRLQGDFPAPVLVVQHIAPGFEGSLVSWLASQCSLPVRMARNGAPATQTGITIAPTGSHLSVTARRLVLSTSELVSGHRPSVTVLLRSVAQEYGSRAVGVVLTGMGQDGAAGLRELRDAGGLCIAQDEESSVVFGMPAAAAGLGAAELILAPERIGDLLSHYNFEPAAGNQ